MNFIVLSLATSISLLFSLSSIASESKNQLRCLYSQPTTKQNIDVNIAECTYLHNFELLTLTDSLTLYPLISAGAIIAEQETGMLLGGGAGFAYEPHEQINIFLEGGGYWLSDYQYGEQGVAFKNYGGDKQFFAKLGASYSFYHHWMIGYAYIHVSNGRRYEKNPSYDGHSLLFGYRF